MHKAQDYLSSSLWMHGRKKKKISEKKKGAEKGGVRKKQKNFNLDWPENADRSKGINHSRQNPPNLRPKNLCPVDLSRFSSFSH